MFSQGLSGLVTKLETNVATTNTDVKEVQNLVDEFGGKMDKVGESLSSTDRVAERAYAVKIGRREDTDRKAKERNAAALLGSACRRRLR